MHLWLCAGVYVCVCMHKWMCVYVFVYCVYVCMCVPCTMPLCLRSVSYYPVTELRAKALEIKIHRHTQTERQRHGSSLNSPRMPPLLCSGADYIEIAMPQSNPPETTLLPSGTPEGLVLRTAIGTQIRGKQEIQDLGSHCSQQLMIDQRADTTKVQWTKEFYWGFL